MRNVAIGVCLLSLLAGCATGSNRTAAPARQRAGHIYMFRGLIGPIATGVDAFSRELRTKGFDAHAYEDVLGHFVAAKIERDYAGAAKREPLVLVGYSSGAVTAVAIARRLNRLHIPVDLLVTLDPTVSEVVPSNVRTCLNYYERTVPGVILLSGTLMRAGAGVKLENIRLNEPNHFTIDESPAMKAAVTARIVEL
jgi:thioesterase domain-containing protein